MKYGILILFVFGLAPAFLFAAPSSFQRALSLGMRGSDVRELQKVLNTDTETLVASVGAGSPGNESDYFGPATKRAVIRFQEKYASEVLVPSGLGHGSGYVGQNTMAKLNAIYVFGVATTSDKAPVVFVSSNSTHNSSGTLATTTVYQNPNLVNIDLYINKIKQDGLRQGYSTSTLSLIEDNIRIGAATTTDFKKQFFDYQKAMYEKKVSGDTIISSSTRFLEKVYAFFGGVFSIEKVYAALGLPFGGYITYVNPAICNCPTPGLLTHLFIASANPNPLQSNLLMTYLNGSQLFNWHNIPMPGIAVLGTYTPAVEACWMWVPAFTPFCVPIPAEGQIDPLVGSSLLPLL